MNTEVDTQYNATTFTQKDHATTTPIVLHLQSIIHGHNNSFGFKTF